MLTCLLHSCNTLLLPVGRSICIPVARYSTGGRWRTFPLTVGSSAALQCCTMQHYNDAYRSIVMLHSVPRGGDTVSTARSRYEATDGCSRRAGRRMQSETGMSQLQHGAETSSVYFCKRLINKHKVYDKESITHRPVLCPVDNDRFGPRPCSE